MIETMKIVYLHMLFVMPVIEEIVMQQRPTYQFPAITADMQLCQLFTERKTALGYIHTVAVYRHSSMLNMLPGLTEIR